MAEHQRAEIHAWTKRSRILSVGRWWRGSRVWLADNRRGDGMHESQKQRIAAVLMRRKLHRSAQCLCSDSALERQQRV
eukprot:1616033-Rhodomonas_salina.2